MNVTRYSADVATTSRYGRFVLYSDYEALAQQNVELRRIISVTAKSLATTTSGISAQVSVLRAIEDARGGMR